MISLCLLCHDIGLLGLLLWTTAYSACENRISSVPKNTFNKGTCGHIRQLRSSVSVPSSNFF